MTKNSDFIAAIKSFSYEKDGKKYRKGMAVAIALGLRTRQSVNDWMKKEVPPKYVLALESLLKIPRSRIRPDLYPEPEEFNLDAALRAKESIEKAIENHCSQK